MEDEKRDEIILEEKETIKEPEEPVQEIKETTKDIKDEEEKVIEEPVVEETEEVNNTVEEETEESTEEDPEEVIMDTGKLIEKEKEKFKISKKDIIKEYVEDNKSNPTWKNKKQKDMSKEEKNEYKKYRKRVENKNKVEKIPEEYYSDDKPLILDEDMAKSISHTLNKVEIDMLPEEEREELEKNKKEDKFIVNYIKHHEIADQQQLNYAIEHDEKFRLFLEKTGRLESFYTGNHLADIEKEKRKVIEQLEKDSKKDKKNKIIKKFAKKKQSNVFEDSRKELDLTAYKNKKLESQGSILALYLRKNGLAEFRYVKMDEVGQIKVDGYVYHERDAVFRIGKKNTPVLIIMEGALVPINKETLKENLGCTSAEAQKLIIKGIEQAEVVKSSGIDENAKKAFAPPKWVIILIIAIIIGIYMFMGGSS